MSTPQHHVLTPSHIHTHTHTHTRTLIPQSEILFLYGFGVHGGSGWCLCVYVINKEQLITYGAVKTLVHTHIHTYMYTHIHRYALTSHQHIIHAFICTNEQGHMRGQHII